MAWYNRNKGTAGALAGGAIGSIVPVVGTVIGAVIGAFVGPAVIADERFEYPDAEPPKPPPDEPEIINKTTGRPPKSEFTGKK